MGDESTGSIKLVTIFELLNRNYFIRSYQRGYRWSKQQVTALLDDIASFVPEGDSWYCLQPLVVREIPNAKKTEYKLDAGKTWYEVIDGQQRLTTIFLIIHYFNEMWEGKSQINEPVIAYETRKDSEVFLKAIKVNDDGKVSIEKNNIDYYHISKAYCFIHKWVIEKEKSNSFNRDQFKSNFQHRAKVIWYLNNEEDPIAVFTRLNIGKIPLTNAELVKALFLSGETIKSEYEERLSQCKNRFEQEQLEQYLENEIKLKQLKIASEWDQIEKALNEKSFWAFLTNEQAEKYPAKIEFLLEMMIDPPNLSDDYTVFDFYYSKIAGEKKSVESVWEGGEQNHGADGNRGIVEVFETIREWYTDRNYYHLVGFLISQDIASAKKILLDTRLMGKSEFEKYLKGKIRDRLKSIPNIKVLEYTNSKDAQDLRDILTLFNILTINKIQDDSQRYPFVSHKAEQWSLEHIQAQTPQKLSTRKEWREWLEAHRDAMPNLEKTEGLLKESDEVLASLDDEKKNQKAFQEIFNELSERITKVFHESEDGGEEIHTIENMALIGFKKNSALNNSVFAVKRRKILEMDKAGSYIPLCTKNVFFKYYTSEANDFTFWDPQDRKAYVEAIKDTLRDYLPRR
jgi:uncharacterized protein with ParB-like and HNH nuclease domain